jgi:DNA-binding MarR family transcriptional regulator
MVEVRKPALPVGYWLKRADKLLTEQIDKAQAANGVSRFEWQVMNMLNEMGSASKERIFESMLAFVDAPGVDEIVTRLVGRGWAEQSEISKQTVEFQLTEEGRRMHGVILATQKTVRGRAIQGISEEEYETVIRVLQRLVSNLEGHKSQ